MFKKTYKTLPFLTLLMLPLFAVAQAGTPLGQTNTFFTNLLSLITDILIPLVFTLALLFFFWGVAKYIWSEGQAKAEGKQIMIWGVVALFVMSSIWGIVYFIRDEFGIQNDVSAPIPTIGGSTNRSGGGTTNTTGGGSRRL